MGRSWNIYEMMEEKGERKGRERNACPTN